MEEEVKKSSEELETLWRTSVILRDDADGLQKIYRALYDAHTRAMEQNDYDAIRKIEAIAEGLNWVLSYNLAVFLQKSQTTD